MLDRVREGRPPLADMAEVMNPVGVAYAMAGRQKASSS
jgi:hypothetical protein